MYVCCILESKRVAFYNISLNSIQNWTHKSISVNRTLALTDGAFSDVFNLGRFI